MMRVVAGLFFLVAPPYDSARRSKGEGANSGSNSRFNTDIESLRNGIASGNSLQFDGATESLRNGNALGNTSTLNANVESLLKGEVSSRSGSAHSQQNKPRWLSFEDAVVQYLFTKSDEESCLGDSLNGKPGFELYAQWYRMQEPSSACEGDAAQVRAKGLREFYANCSMQELLGKSKMAVLQEVKALQGFEDKYLEHARVWPVGQEATPEKQSVVEGEKPKAIFVLGASGSGKTYSTKVRLESILEKNAWDTALNFVSLDGGLMRDISVVWNEVKLLVKELPAKARIVGFSDAFKAIGKAGSNAAKKKMQLHLIEQRKNIIIPDTLSSVCAFNNPKYSPLLCPAMQLYDTLVDATYDVVLVAINTDSNNCMAQGNERAPSENKQYDSKGWKLQTLNLAAFFCAARYRGNDHVFMITDNNNHKKISVLEHCEQESGAKCREGKVRWYHKRNLSTWWEAWRLKHTRWHAQVSLQVSSGRVDYPCGEDISCEQVPDDHGCPQQVECLNAACEQ
eukprot:TRINITY_DN12940_c0_g5_i1.p1 TRINITY_DN12940_c0_g5~~TRINITY_DN12940_c0_g5_i1.p1  ORF type:complete len:511 (+),score=71.39 TRINITY_DN12940_c0_g5_i1:53-1585(+)